MLKRFYFDRLQKQAALVLTALCLFSATALAGDIRIGGTGNALGTMKLLAQAYNQSHAHKAVVLESLGSSGGIRAVAQGAIDIALSSRTLDLAEKESGLRITEYARSPTVFAVRKQNPTKAITLKEIIDICYGKRTHWPDGTLIRPVLRQPGEDNTKQTLALSPEMKAALRFLDKRSGMAYAVTDQEAASKMENIPGSIGVSTLPLILSEKRNLRPLTLDGVAPTLENMRAGRYPMVKHFYYVLPKRASPAARDFIAFLHSEKGRAILRRNGHTMP